MLKELTAVLNAFYVAAKGLHEHFKRADTERQQLALLTAQYCFAGLANTGKQLLELTGPKPLDKLTSLSPEELRDFNAVTQRHMSLQQARLGKLHGIVQDQHVIELFDMSLQAEITGAIGDKERGLYSIGAGLVLYFLFMRPSPESSEPRDNEHTAELICAMYPEIEAGVISIPLAVKALDELNALAQRYGEVLRQLVPADRYLVDG